MNFQINKLRAFLLVLAIFILQTTRADGQQKDTKKNELLYKKINDGNDIKIQLTLNGPSYTAENHCIMKKVNQGLTAYEDIVSCVGTVEGVGTNKCIRKCLHDGNILPVNKLNTDSKYIVVFTDSDSTRAANKNNEGIVFGFELKLLVNPKVTITTTTDSKLKISTKTCPSVNCPIYYKGVEYATGTKGSDCNALVNSEIEFDLMVPYYEMRCDKYPSFFYYLQNNYTLTALDVYKPQYYVAFTSNDKTKYSLKFTNKFRFEICRFSIKDGTNPSAESTNEYKSNCGVENKECYAPCNNVDLTFTTSKRVVDVLIQSRHNSLNKVGQNYFGHQQVKFVVDESTPNSEFLRDITNEGVSLNVPLLNSNTGPKFTTCALTYYAADKPPPTGGLKAKCNNSNTDCDNKCDGLRILKALENGKPYILKIAATSPGTDGLPNSFKEHIFFRTDKGSEKSFSTKAVRLDETTASIQALPESSGITKEDPTCAYYISPRGKNVFVCAMCTESYPCRGFCKETQSIVGLIPDVEYDLMILAHMDYGYTLQKIMKFSTLTLKLQFIGNGIKLAGSLSNEDPTAKCSYKVNVKRGETYNLIHECPTSSISPKETNEKIKGASKFPKINVARSTGQTSTPVTKNKLVTTCTELPLCSEIIFTNTYDRLKSYQALVTVVGLSQEVSIDIPPNPLPKSDINKNLSMSIERDGNKLKITSILPDGMTESTCGWELRISSNAEKPILKSCNGENDTGCEGFPLCKEFEITDVQDEYDYELTVYVSTDNTIVTTREIKEGDTHDTMKSTIIASVVTVAIIGAIGIGLFVIKKRN